MWRNRYVFMGEEGSADAGGAGTGGSSGESGSVGSSAGATSTGNDGGGTGGASSAAESGNGSVLASGAASGEGSQSGTFDYIPEKYRVTKDDGTVDVESSSRKLAEAYASAEKRIGTGDIPPKTADEYQIAVPDAIKETWNPAEDKEFTEFRNAAHAKGFTQDQMNLVMETYFNMAPKLVAGAQVLDSTGCKAELQKTWATDADFNRNLRNAFTGAKAISERAGIPIDDIMNSSLGNDPKFLKLMAAIGPEFMEDKIPGGQAMTSQDDIDALMRSEAYTNPKHADHARVSDKVSKYFQRKFGTEAAA